MTPRRKRLYVARGYGCDELISSSHDGSGTAAAGRRWGWRSAGIFVLASVGTMAVGRHHSLLGEPVFWVGWAVGSVIWWATFLAMARPWERRP